MTIKCLRTRIIIFAFLIVSITLSSFDLPVMADNSAVLYQSTITTLIQRSDNPEETYGKLYDLNDDGVQELIVIYPENSVYYYSVYSQENSSLVKYIEHRYLCPAGSINGEVGIATYKEQTFFVAHGYEMPVEKYLFFDTKNFQEKSSILSIKDSEESSSSMAYYIGGKRCKPAEYEYAVDSIEFFQKIKIRGNKAIGGVQLDTVIPSSSDENNVSASPSPAPAQVPESSPPAPADLISSTPAEYYESYVSSTPTEYYEYVSSTLSDDQALALAEMYEGLFTIFPKPTVNYSSLEKMVNYFSLENDIWQSSVLMSDKDVKIVAAEDAEEELNTAELKEFLNQYETARAASKAGNGRKLQKAYWYGIPTNNLMNGSNYAKFAFFCPGENVEATLNGEPVELIHYPQGSSYYAKMTGCGVLLIFSDTGSDGDPHDQLPEISADVSPTLPELLVEISTP